jgi:exonuclease III
MNLTIISVNIQGGWENKEEEIQKTIQQDKLDIVLIQEIQKTKEKAKFIKMDRYTIFTNCVSNKFLRKSNYNNNKEIPTNNNPTIRPINNTRHKAKWGVAILVKNELSPHSLETTPTDKTLKGRVVATKIRSTTGDIINIINVYAPANKTNN